MSLPDLYLCWQCEAQESQEIMERLDEDDLDPHRDEHYAYWRGRRDGFETAAWMLRDGGHVPSIQ